MDISGSRFGDTLIGTIYGDDIRGRRGDDLIRGEVRADRLYGQGDNDTIFGGPGNDRIYSGAGNDSLSGDEGEDQLFGEDGQDTLTSSGSSGPSGTLSGGNGDDLILAYGHMTLAYGEGGDDHLESSVNRAELYGGAGNDSLVSHSNRAALYGGDGDDTLTSISDASRKYYSGLYGGDGDDLIGAAAGGSRAYGGEGNDTLIGDDGRDLLRGDFGHDVIVGHGGDDGLLGGNGFDRLRGQDGDDDLYGEQGNDTLRGAAGDDSLEGGTGADLVDGGSGRDTLDGGSGNDTLTGGGHADTFILSEGDNIITDFGPQDTLDLRNVAYDGASMSANADGDLVLHYTNGSTTVVGLAAAGFDFDSLVFGDGPDLEINDPVVAQLVGQNDSDSFRPLLEPYVGYTITLRPYGDHPASLLSLWLDGTNLTPAPDGTVIEGYTVLTQTEARLSVRGNDGLYEIEIEAGPAPDDHADVAEQATPIAPGTAAFGTIESVGDVDWFSATLNAGSSYSAEVLAAPLAGLAGGSLMVVDPAGETVDVSNGVFGAGESGVYSFAVASDGERGRYELHVDALNAPADDYGETPASAYPIDLEAGDVELQGAIETANDSDWFAFPSNTGVYGGGDNVIENMRSDELTVTRYDLAGNVVEDRIHETAFIEVSSNGTPVDDYTLRISIETAGDFHHDIYDYFLVAVI